MKFTLKKAPLIFVIKEINRCQGLIGIMSKLIKMDSVMII